ncbi:Cell division GTP binding [Cordyceps militaris]|uniref:Cell division GTP binding n=1 Tax=Cordyceps militaris TaxID=73501 RepID=A0A2H4S8R9_CORMI|nr:Cell division GTP binding [Cordyceps militaris]
MRPVPSPRASVGALRDYTHSATSQSLETSSCFLVTEADMDLKLDTDSIVPRGRSIIKCEPVVQRNALPSPMASSPVVGSEKDTVAEFSAPNTPHMYGLSRPESSLSFLSSPRNLSSSSSAVDRDGSIEDAIITQQHMETYRDLPPSSAGSPVPQLIMPNLLIPRRRPFTTVGRSLGKLRLLVLGSPGTGKTSIIRSIYQCCEHIVHIDAVNTHFSGPVLETHASTRPYQWWQTEIPSETLRRRSSTSVEDILDRNICFLDFTPQSPISTRHAFDFLESTLAPLLEKQMADADLISLLSNGNEPIVHAVLYMLPSTGLTKTDVDALTRLQAVTNIIPLLARSDELDEPAIEDCKQYLRNEIDDGGIDVFSFTLLDGMNDHTGIFAVSNATQTDNDIMDASILMNSAYIKPLLPTDLDALVESIFSLEGASRLRYSAAAKAVKWAHEQHRYHPSDWALTRRTLKSGSTVTVLDPFFQMRDWRRVEIWSWAQSLRHSLDSERILHSTTSNELIARASGTVARRAGHHRGDRKRWHTHTYDQDPLGLVRLAAQVKNTSAFAVELIGGIGVVGYLALCLMKPDLADRNVRLFSPSFFAV